GRRGRGAVDAHPPPPAPRPRPGRRPQRLAQSGLTRYSVCTHDPRTGPMFSYTCPNCNEALVLDKAVAPGKKVKCANCDFVFIPNKETFAVAKDPHKAAKPAAAKPAPAPAPAPAAAAPAAPKRIVADEDDETKITAYGLVKESEEEARAAEKNKPKFTNIQE